MGFNYTAAAENEDEDQCDRSRKKKGTQDMNLCARGVGDEGQTG